jgi:hypothetical protein
MPEGPSLQAKAQRQTVDVLQFRAALRAKMSEKCLYH